MAYLSEDEFIMSVPHQLQLLVALRYMASGNFQITMGDCGEMSTASVSKYVKITAMAIARQASHHIRFPEPDEARSLGSQFYDIAGMPGVIGCIDGSHVKIISPGGDNAEVYSRIPIEDGFEHPEEQIGEHYHEGEGEAHNVAGGPHRRQALI
ncbi:hypothetical protein Pcinc_012273 [Petrolisthes cinctipes]|uniref:Harbinger transposase-derived nuclease n=1 Tax=Petrolisthes cinctipes TaxID=88211 RepID=A0AAE1FZR8_PETCI|nr:hypothetical protein Pcinc_012273 [Petrolisthes cinctipes]